MGSVLESCRGRDVENYLKGKNKVSRSVRRILEWKKTTELIMGEGKFSKKVSRNFEKGHECSLRQLWSNI